MSSLRSFYPLQSVFVSASPATGQASTGISQLSRIQSFAISENISRENVEELGRYDLVSQEIVKAPTVSLDLSAVQNNFWNETQMGFVTNGLSGALSNFQNNTQIDKNYYVTFVPEGISSESWTGQSSQSVIGIGNGVMGSYSSSARVGSFPTSSFKIEGLDIKYDIMSANIDPPCINPALGSGITGIAVTLPYPVTGNGSISVVHPQQIQVTLSNPTYGVLDYSPQGYNLQCSLNLTPLQSLGQPFPFARVITYPLAVSISLETNLQDLNTGRLSSFICSDAPTDVLIQLFAPGCSGALGALQVGYRLTNCKFDSRSFDSRVGQQTTTMPLSYKTYVGGPVPILGGGNFLMSGVSVL